MGLVKTRRLAAMQKQHKAKTRIPLPKPKPDKRRLGASPKANGAVR